MHVPPCGCESEACGCSERGIGRGEEGEKKSGRGRGLNPPFKLAEGNERLLLQGEGVKKGVRGVRGGLVLILVL